MAKKQRKQRTTSGSLAGPARLTRKQLLDGVAGPEGVRIGFAVPGEASTLTSLLKAAADDLETGLVWPRPQALQ
jgi:hypothetical protein